MTKSKFLALFIVISMMVVQVEVMAAETEKEYVSTTYGEAAENGFDIQDGVLVKYTGKSARVVIPEGVTSIGERAFSLCGIKEVTIPGSVESIGNSAFLKCSRLTDVKIENGVKIIGNSAFQNCIELRELTLPESVTSIGDTAFGFCDFLKKVTLSGNVESIGNSAFRFCNALTEITLPGSLKNIGKEAFYNCPITEVTLSASVENIGDYAFRDCDALTKVTIENGVKNIGSCAFFGCSGLKEMMIPRSVDSIGEGLLYGCSGLESIHVDAGNKTYNSGNGCNAIIETETKKLIAGCKNTIISSDVTSIEEKAFSGCSSLTEMTIPVGVKSIGDRAFYKCTGLTKMTILGNVESIGEEAFYHCESLTKVTVPGSVTSIRKGTFEGCISLAEVTIPESVGSIGNYAFSFCNSLTQVTIPGNVTDIGIDAFRACMGLTKVEIKNGVKNIGNYAFNDCRSLTEVAIPESVEGIGYHAFGDCGNLTIYGVEGSCAQEYAERYDFSFRQIGEWENILETANIASCQIGLSQTSYVYDGTEKEPSVMVKDGEKLLVLGTDYTVSYTNNKAVGTATVTITGTGGYTGIATRTFEIKNRESTQEQQNKKSQNISCPKKTFNKSYSDKSFLLNVGGTKGIVTYTSFNKKVAEVSKNGKVTIKGTGVAIIEVNAAGNDEYKSASVEITINVSPKKPSLSKPKALGGKKLKVSWKKDKQASGYKIQYSIDKNFGKKNTKTETISKQGTTSKTLKKLKMGEMYYVRICAYKKVKVGGNIKTLRGAWCKAKKSAKIK